MPGVLTPLSWSFWGWSRRAVEPADLHRQVRRLRDGRAHRRCLADTTTAALFHGRAAVNVDLLRRVLDRVPGTDPDALELQVLGRVRPDAVSNPTSAPGAERARPTRRRTWPSCPSADPCASVLEVDALVASDHHL